MGKKEHTHKLSELAGVDEELFKGRKPSKELKVTRKEWDEEFDKRIQQTHRKRTENKHK